MRGGTPHASSDENVGAEQLHKDGWTSLACELLERDASHLFFRRQPPGSGPRCAHLAPGHTELIEQFEFAPQLRAGDFSSQQLPILLDGLQDLLRGLVEKLDSKMAHA